MGKRERGASPAPGAWQSCKIGNAAFSRAVICSALMKQPLKKAFNDVAPCPDAPDYEPELWTGHPFQFMNNCYSYAVNDMRRDRPAMPAPGGKAGLTLEQYRSLPLHELITWLQRDGLERASGPVARPGHYLVAFALQLEFCPAGDRQWRMVDGHFWRQDADGLWSHKPGMLLPSREDASGRQIVMPHQCDRGIYDEFMGYFHVPKGGLQVESWKDMVPHPVRRDHGSPKLTMGK